MALNVELKPGQPSSDRGSAKVFPEGSLPKITSALDDEDSVQPRILTEDEIDEIVRDIPYIKGATEASSESVRKSIQSKLRMMLRTRKVTPLAKTKLKKEINDHLSKAIIPVGTPVGPTAVEAIVQPIMQMSLNTFHSAGSAKNASGGIGQIQSIISASEHLKNENDNIYFTRDDYSFENIIKTFKPKLVSLSVGDLIMKKGPSYEIENPIDYFQGTEPWWYHNYRQVINGPLPFIGDSNINTPVKFLRLYLDINVLNSFKVEIEDVCSAIEIDVPKVVNCVYSPLLIQKISPDDKGTVLRYIDIYPVEEYIAPGTIPGLGTGLRDKERAEAIANADRDMKVTRFLQLVLVALGKIYIGGVVGIEDIEPVETPVWSSVKTEYRLRSVGDIDPIFLDHPVDQLDCPVGDLIAITEVPSDQRLWRLVLNSRKMKEEGITVSKIMCLCKFVGMTVLYAINVDELKSSALPEIIVRLPSHVPSDMLKDLKDGEDLLRPGRLVKYYLNLDQEDEKNYAKNKREEIRTLKRRRAQLLRQSENNNLPDTDRKSFINEAADILEKIDNISPLRPTTPAFRAGKLTSAITDGTNLADLFIRDDIDATRSYSNNMYEILNTLGIEATRTFLIHIISKAIEIGSGYINPQNTTLLVDFMTRGGDITKITFSGIQKQPTGILDRASFQQSTKVISTAAATGTRETTLGISSSVALGKMAAIGAGYSVGITKKAREDMMAKLASRFDREPEEENSLPSFDPNYLKSALDNLITGGNNNFNLIGGATNDDLADTALDYDFNVLQLPTATTNETSNHITDPFSEVRAPNVHGHGVDAVLDKVKTVVCKRDVSLGFQMEMTPLTEGIKATDLERPTQSNTPSLALPDFSGGLDLPDFLAALI